MSKLLLELEILGGLAMTGQLGTLDWFESGNWVDSCNIRFFVISFIDDNVTRQEKPHVQVSV